jgi:hypothetical protein
MPACVRTRRSWTSPALLAVADTAFRPEAIFEALADHGVRFVLIGGFAAMLHGSPYATFDVDVVPSVDPANLTALSNALKAIHARVWTNDEPDGLAFDHSGGSLARSKIWNLVTDHGRLDITFEPSGTAGFDDLRRDSVSLAVGGHSIDVASLADVIRSKQAAGRMKDQLVLPVLREILGGGPPPDEA